MAMLKHLDIGVGRIVETLKKEGVWENTLLFFLTDNGGSKAMHAINTPLRGFKQWNYEGGIRTPFIVSWPARFKGGRSLDTPIISLDILPTALNAAGLPAPSDKPFDGKSLLPVLGGKTGILHEQLFWSEGGRSGEWAVRRGKWKLVAQQNKVELFDLDADPSETTALNGEYPEKLQELSRLYDAWLDQMAEPLSSQGKRWAEKAQSEPQDERQKQRLERRKERKAARTSANQDGE
jgi:arylsulfatase A-like enzyme